MEANHRMNKQRTEHTTEELSEDAHISVSFVSDETSVSTVFSSCGEAVPSLFFNFGVGQSSVLKMVTAKIKEDCLSQTLKWSKSFFLKGKI